MLKVFVTILLGAVALAAQPQLARQIEGRVDAISVALEQTAVGRIPVTTARIGNETVRVPGGRWGNFTLHVSELPQIRVGRRVRLQTVGGRAYRGEDLDRGMDRGAVIGPKWPMAEVPYLVDPANADVPPAVALAAIQWAANVWATEAHPGVRMVYAGPTTGASTTLNYRNEVFFSPAAEGGTIAVAYYWSENATGNFVDSDIVFYDGGFQFFTGTEGCANGIYIEDPAVHEFGHTLGLAHSSVPEATMYPTLGWCSQAWRSLDADDITTIEALYPGAPPPPPPPPPPPSPPINLRVTPYKVKGVQHVQAEWAGATTAHVVVKKDGATLATAANDGAELFNLNRKGSGTYQFQVCELGTSVCSAVVPAVF